MILTAATHRHSELDSWPNGRTVKFARFATNHVDHPTGDVAYVDKLRSSS
jgi:hypothetical protein